MSRLIPITVANTRDEYANHLRARGMAPSTVKGHIQILNRWVTLMGDTKVSYIRPQHIDRFFGAAGWSPKTQNLYLSQIRAYFAWCRRMNYLDRAADPTEGWRAVRGESREQFWLPPEEFAALLDASDDPRDRAIIAIGMYTFLRGSEIASLKIQDLDLTRNTLSVYRQKTKDADTLPVCEELAVEMERWLRDYRKLMVFHQGLTPEWYLIPNRKGTVPVWDYEKKIVLSHRRNAELRPESRIRRPYEAVNRALRELGYDMKGTGAHTLRRSGARALFDRLRSEGYDGALRRVSAMLGHKDTKTTEVYLGLSLERLQRNELLAGKPMFPALQKQGGKVIPLREVDGGNGA